MKRILLLSVVALLAACDPYSKEIVPQVLPAELKDCKFYTVNISNAGPILNIVRCPASDVSVLPSQKNPVATVTTDSGVPGQADAAARAAKVDAILKQIDENIARLEAQKKELQK